MAPPVEEYLEPCPGEDPVAHVGNALLFAQLSKGEGVGEQQLQGEIKCV